MDPYMSLGVWDEFHYVVFPVFKYICHVSDVWLVTSDIKDIPINHLRLKGLWPREVK